MIKHKVSVFVFTVLLSWGSLPWATMQEMTICNGKIDLATRGQLFELPEDLTIIPVGQNPNADFFAYTDNQAFECKLPTRPSFQRARTKYFVMGLELGPKKHYVSYARHPGDYSDISVFPVIAEMAIERMIVPQEVTCNATGSNRAENQILNILKIKLSIISKKFIRDRSLTRALKGPQEHETSYYEALMAC